MKPADPIEITQLPHGTRLQKGDVWTVLVDTEQEPATRAYAQAITLARIVFGPRWQAIGNPNLSESAFEALLQRIVFDWLYTCALNHKPLAVTADDLAHPYSWRRVRAAVSRELPGAAPAAQQQLTAALLAVPIDDYQWWLRQEALMDEVR